MNSQFQRRLEALEAAEPSTERPRVIFVVGFDEHESKSASMGNGTVVHRETSENEAAFRQRVESIALGQLGSRERVTLVCLLS